MISPRSFVFASIVLSLGLGCRSEKPMKSSATSTSASASASTAPATFDHRVAAVATSIDVSCVALEGEGVFWTVTKSENEADSLVRVAAAKGGGQVTDARGRIGPCRTFGGKRPLERRGNVVWSLRPDGFGDRELGKPDVVDGMVAAASDDTLFMATDGALSAVDLASGTARKIPLDGRVSLVGLSGDTLVVGVDEKSDDGARTFAIETMKKSGGVATTLNAWPGGCACSDLRVDPGVVAWIAVEPRGIGTLAVDGGKPVTLSDTATALKIVRVDGDEVFWVDATGLHVTLRSTGARTHDYPAHINERSAIGVGTKWIAWFDAAVHEIRATARAPR
jgi:hypothetical protein